MKALSKDNFVKATKYIKQNADEINLAWYSYNFEDLTTDEFMEVLSKYQYENGGFGGLFYEFDYKGPCLKSTEIAIDYILNLRDKPSSSNPIIQKMMKYILDRYHPEIGNWGDVAEPQVNDGIFNHWVRYRGEEIVPIENDDERIEKYDANEKVCFVAFVAYYSELVPEQLYLDIIKYPVEYLKRYWDKDSPKYKKSIFEDGTPYDFEYFQRFIPCLKDRKMSNELSSILCQNPTVFMELDFAKSDNDYVHLPCDSVYLLSDFLYEKIKDLADKSFEYRINQQGDNGIWALGWSFGDSHEFQKLQLNYEIYRSINFLVKLKKFERLER